MALYTKNVNMFLNPDGANKGVLNFSPNLDKHRKDDVAKMLRVIAKSMYIEHTTPSEVKEYIDNKLKLN